ncbi:hypothetical protein [Xenorhabdus bovienii]|uniref:Phage protein n=3 Tax=Xenorhabdus bovienii TaxID=40576 RepID=A0A077QGR6_XENBV|nr:hypothetical protein [Xenorhabdus bovienii]MCP9267851.1 hypothetical protein [Xenorhabdus bovienii subsp. africana]CDG88167.1 conserved hypothetical protein [Xenorhabdus bovienii str. feltiae France]CDG93168.1 conserved hypothetical protein [Xenorhabdus bovienii str. feltiae Florida]CDH02856.1 conserved hypothetical protein [Xenorhabdus bovienii str. feltiae Moldova]CDH06079.1 conserved hypothetical protein [Xenorhabdus bovienii str. oregonense]
MSQIITLALDGEAIPLKSLTVTPSMMFQDADQSGQSSSTAVAEQGIKPKELRITGIIPFTEQKTFARLFALAEAKENGNLKRYRVANLTAQAINFRIGTFTSTLDASKVDGKQAWQVTFTLREHLSVSEKRDARAVGTIQAKKQTRQGAGAAKEEPEQLSWFEREVLKPINDKIGAADETP